MAGMAAVQAAYTVTDGNDCEEVAENDEELASDEWDAAFLASLSCNGGAADLSEINPESNRNFGNGILPTVFHTFMKTKNIPDAMPVTKSAYRHRQIAM